MTRWLPVATVLLCVLALWYAGAVGLNRAGAVERVLPNSHPQGDWALADLVAVTLNMERPVLPAPHQVAADLYSSIVDWPLDSPRNLLYHAAVTAQSTLVGFVLGTLLGVLLAAAIVHSRTLGPGAAALDRGQPDGAGAGHRAHRAGDPGQPGLQRRGAQGHDRDVPVLLPGDGGHGAGPACAAAHRDRADAHLCRQPAAGLLAAAPAVGAALPVPQPAGGDRRRPGGRDGGRAAHRRPGRAGRAPAHRQLLRQHRGHLVGAGAVGPAGPGADAGRGGRWSGWCCGGAGRHERRQRSVHPGRQGRLGRVLRRGLCGGPVVAGGPGPGAAGLPAMALAVPLVALLLLAGLGVRRVAALDGKPWHATATAALFGLWVLYFWQVGVTLFDVPRVLLPAPSWIGQMLVDRWDTLAARLRADRGQGRAGGLGAGLGPGLCRGRGDRPRALSAARPAAAGQPDQPPCRWWRWRPSW